MNPILLIITVAAAIANVAFGAAVPVSSNSDITAREDAASNPAIQYIVGNASTIFGLELADYFLNEDESGPVCANLNSLGHGKWAAINLIPALIQAPICASPNPDPAHFRQKAIPVNTELLITQILNSVSTKGQLAYLCHNLGWNLISSFPLDGDTVKHAVCKAAGLGPLPRPEATLAGAPQPAVTAANNQASIIFANLLAAGATTDSQLNIECAHIPEHVPNLNAMKLNGDLIRHTFCSHHQPIPVATAQTQLATVSTQYFIIVMKNISTTSGWLKWLCSNLNVAKMNSVGLVGASVHNAVCNNS